MSKSTYDEFPDSNDFLDTISLEDYAKTRCAYFTLEELSRLITLARRGAEAQHLWPGGAYKVPLMQSGKGLDPGNIPDLLVIQRALRDGKDLSLKHRLALSELINRLVVPPPPTLGEPEHE